MIRIATMQKMKKIASPMKMYGKLLLTNASKRDPIVRGRINTTPRRIRLSEMIALRLIFLPNVQAQPRPKGVGCSAWLGLYLSSIGNNERNAFHSYIYRCCSILSEYC